MCETEESLQVLQKEYETIWSYVTHLDRERRDAIRLLFTALPWIPAAVYGVAYTRSGGTLSAKEGAPLMIPLLLVLWLLGTCYFGVIVGMRAANVEWVRKLNLTRKHLLLRSPAYAKDLACLDPQYQDPCKPDYPGRRWGADWCYWVLAAIPASAVAGMVAYFISVIFVPRTYATVAGVFAFIIWGGIWGGLMLTLSLRHLKGKDSERDRLQSSPWENHTGACR